MNDNYELLKKAGHSPVKAAEIILDAKRGDAYAIQWINIIRGEQHIETEDEYIDNLLQNKAREEEQEKLEALKKQNIIPLKEFDL
jgi:hypothetical protein